MFPISPAVALEFLIWTAGVGAFVGFLLGQAMSRVLRRLPGPIWLDATLGAVGSLLALCISGQLATHSRHDGLVLSVRDFITNYELVFAIIVVALCVAAGRLIRRKSRQTGKLGAA